MNWEYSHLLPADFSPHARVWIYQSNRRLSLQEALETERQLDAFTENWMTHGAPVKGYANLLFGQFILLMADETGSTVSGCSTDSSVRMIKSLESSLGITLFDRQLLAFRMHDSIELVPLSQFSYAYSNHFINGETIYFNNLVETKQALETEWMIPVNRSWLRKLVTAGAET